MSNDFQYLDADAKRVGTSKYRGHAYFWAHEYRHSLRNLWVGGLTERRDGELLQKLRRRVHADFRCQGLKLAGESPAHRLIIAYQVARIEVEARASVGRTTYRAVSA
jgi:hypothetical protein